MDRAGSRLPVTPLCLPSLQERVWGPGSAHLLDPSPPQLLLPGADLQVQPQREASAQEGSIVREPHCQGPARTLQELPAGSGRGARTSPTQELLRREREALPQTLVVYARLMFEGLRAGREPEDCSDPSLTISLCTMGLCWPLGQKPSPLGLSPHLSCLSASFSGHLYPPQQQLLQPGRDFDPVTFSSQGHICKGLHLKA